MLAQFIGAILYLFPCGGYAGDLPFHKPPDVPPLKFIRDKIPAAKVPTTRGKEEDAFIPDTCSLEESARLFVDNYLANNTVAELFHEPVNAGNLGVIPPRLTVDFGGYLCGLPKYREALPLLRMMCGSQKALEIDKAWAEQVLHCIGPDGLFYIPRIGRPWDHGDYLRLPTQAPPQDFYCSLPVATGRLLGALAIYYQTTGDEVWNRTARGVVDGLNEVAIKTGKIAFFPRFNLSPGERLTPEEIKAEIAAMNEQTTGESARNKSLWETWIITGLAQYYRVSHYEPARTLAYGLIEYLRETHYVEDWKSHFHCITLGIQAMLEWSIAAQDPELAEYARKAYDFAKSGKTMIAFPQIGFFTNSREVVDMEGCSIADMTALAVKLTQLGMGDEYWDDIDRYVRNCLIAHQWTRPDQMEAFLRVYAQTNKLPTEPVTFNCFPDHLSEQVVGAFSCHSAPNEMLRINSLDGCCPGNCARALYYAWESILNFKNGELAVNLLLNRTSPWADVDSFIPYVGRVDIHIKQRCAAVKVRMNHWIAKDKVTCRVNGKPREFAWEGNDVVCGKLRSGQTVSLNFPIEERTEQLESFGHKYTAVFKGNDCVDLNPRGNACPLFQRDNYRFNEPRYIKVKRFACENAIKY